MTALSGFSAGKSVFSLFCRNLLIRKPYSVSQCLYSQDVQKERESVAEDGALKLSDTCVKKLKSFGGDDNSVRVVVEGGGCSGFQYKFELDNTVGPEDRVFEREGVKVIVDVDSLEFIKGSTLDYEEELIRSSFKITSNPLAEHGCSCGASFSLK